MPRVATHGDVRSRETEDRIQDAIAGIRQLESRRVVSAWTERSLDRRLCLEYRLHVVTTAANFFQAFRTKTPGEVTPDDVSSWLRSNYYRQGLAPATARLAWAALRHMVPHAAIKDNKPVGRSEPRATPETTLTEEEVYRLVDAAPTALGRALIAFTFDTAARASEVCRVRLIDLSFPDDRRILVRVPNSKLGLRRGKHAETERKLWLDRARPYLRAWLNAHPARTDPNAPLFPTIMHGVVRTPKVSKALVQGYLARAQSRVRLSKPVSPHLLRHARLTQWANLGVPETKLKLLAGWAPNSAMVETYIHLTSAQVTEELSRAIEEMEPPKPQVRLACRNCLGPIASTKAFCPTCGARPDELPGGQPVEDMQTIVDRRVQEVEENMDKRIEERLDTLVAWAIERVERARAPPRDRAVAEIKKMVRDALAAGTAKA